MKYINKKIILLIMPVLLFSFALKADSAIVKSSTTSGLVGYWSFNEGVGTTAHDGSGNNNNGTLTNGPTWTNGKLGKGLNFAGSSTYVNIATTTLTGPFTVSLWWNSSDSTTANMAIGIHAEGGGTTAKIGILSSNFFVRIVSTSDNTVALPTANMWHFIVVTRNTSDKVDLRVDGRAASRLFSDVAQSGNFTPSILGNSGNGSNGQPFIGKLDEVRIYNRVLSAAEIATLYQSGAEKYVAPTNTGLVGYWSFNEGAGTTAHDSSGNKGTGTLTSGPTWVDGKQGKALNFTNGPYVSVPHQANQLVTGGLTISAWINPTGSGGNTLGRIVEKATDSGSTGGFGYFMLSNGVRFQVNGGTSRDAGANSIIYNKWTHVLVTVTSGATVTHYINGVQSGTPGTTGALSGITTSNPLLIGQSASGSRGFAGKIDEVSIYNRVLSAAEIATLYNAGR